VDLIYNLLIKLNMKVSLIALALALFGTTQVTTLRVDKHDGSLPYPFCAMINPSLC
jgi:hypothetical protein